MIGTFLIKSIYQIHNPCNLVKVEKIEEVTFLGKWSFVMLTTFGVSLLMSERYLWISLKSTESVDPLWILVCKSTESTGVCRNAQISRKCQNMGVSLRFYCCATISGVRAAYVGCYRWFSGSQFITPLKALYDDNRVNLENCVEVGKIRNICWIQGSLVIVLWSLYYIWCFISNC